MRTTLSFPLILALGCTPLASFAQIPNAGFENWSDQGGNIVPDGWLTYNDISTWDYPSVAQGTPGHPGNYHAWIQTRLTFPGGTPLQGWASVGSDSNHSGFPFTQQPAALTGQWQYDIQPTDAGLVTVAFSKWNSATHTTDVIGYGMLQVTGNIDEWGTFSVPVSYSSSADPDTAYIQFESSADMDNMVAGSYIRVDDLSFSGTAGIHEQAGLQTFRIFPTPATDVLNIISPSNGELRIYDTIGRLLKHSTISDRYITLDISHLAPGLFSYQLLDDRGRLVAAGHWMKQ
jgi:hypothetical protein